MASPEARIASDKRFPTRRLSAGRFGIAQHLLGLALAASLPFLALTAYLSYSAIVLETNEASDDLRRSSQVTANSLERLLARIQTLLERVAERERIRSLDPLDCDPALAAILSFNPEYTNVFTVKADGTRACSALPYPPTLASKKVDPKLFLDAVKTRGRFVLGLPSRGAISGKLVVYAAQPILADGKVIGVVAVGIDLTVLTQLLRPATTTRTGATAIIDQTGLVITRYPNPEAWVGRDASTSLPAIAARRGGSGTLRADGIDGVDRFWAYAPVTGSGWVVTTGLEASAVLARPHAYAAWLLALSAAITIGAITLSRIVARRIADPIEAMATAAPQLGTEGALPLTLAGPSEAIALAAELNRHSAARATLERHLEHERARLEALISSAMDGVITVDATNRIVLFNAAAERMFGVSTATALAMPLDRLISIPFQESQDTHLAQLVASAEAHPLRRVQGLRASGEEFPIEAAISQVEVHGERYVTAIVRDISERTKAEIRIRELAANLESRVIERTAQLEAANKELRAFDYSISHDLRAPIARILGFTAVLREDHAALLPEEARDMLRRVTVAAERMDQLVGDLLELSTVSQSAIQRTRVDIEAMAHSVLEALKESDPGRHVDLVIHHDLVAQADRQLVRIVLDNLLGNAWKFTARRTDARIEVGSADIDGVHRAFFVRDNGAGFDPARADTLFEPFRRLHSQEEFPGTGIGLASVSRIVRRHGGRVWAEGAVGSGAVFYFTLET